MEKKNRFIQDLVFSLVVANNNRNNNFILYTETHNNMHNLQVKIEI